MEQADPEIVAALLRERSAIDNFDAALIHILAERFRCTERVGHIKARGGLPRRIRSAMRSRCADSVS